MTLDVAHHISEVSRTVGTRTLESGEARVLTASRVYPTDVDDLWDAVTNPDRIARWFLPVSGDLRVGGRYSLQGNADGTIEECEPPNRFAATWEFGGQVSWIEVRIEEEDDGQDDHEVSPGDSVSIEFDKPGTYHYVCRLHRHDMDGDVIVR